MNAARILRKRTGDEDAKGADTRTFVFSAALCADVMETLVHCNLIPGVMEIWVNLARKAMSAIADRIFSFPGCHFEKPTS